MEEAQTLLEMPPKAKVRGRNSLASLFLPPSKLIITSYRPNQNGRQWEESLGKRVQSAKEEQRINKFESIRLVHAFELVNHLEFLSQ